MRDPDKNRRTDNRELLKAESDEKLCAVLGLSLFNAHFRKFTGDDLFLKHVYMPDPAMVCATLCFGETEGTIAIWPADDECRTNCLAQTDKLRFAYHFDDSDKFNLIYEYFIKYLCVRLRDASFESVIGCFDEKRIREWRRAYGVNSNEIRKKYFGNPDQWRSFVCQRALDRNVSGVVRMLDRVATVNHGELECRFATLEQGRNFAYFFNYPWSRQQKGSCRKGLRGGNYDTDISEMDMIMGPRRKLESVLEKAASNLGEADMLWINTTCISEVVGDDFEDLALHWQGICGIPVFCSGPKTNEIMRVFSIMIEKHRGGDAAGGETRALPRDTINLLGFPCLKGTDEVLEILDAMEVKINVRMLPEISFPDLGRIADARTNLLFPAKAYEEFYDAALAGVEADRLLEPAPYGMGKTEKWLMAVAKSTGKSRKFKQVWNRRFGDVAERWSRLRAEASEFRLAFVLDRIDLDCMRNENLNYSVDPLNFLQEIGFKVRILLYVDNDSGRKEAVGLEQNLKGCEVAAFSTPEELSALLEAEDVNAVYSDYFFDDRIADAGKAQFSLNDFEMGIQGALRTAEALLRICRLPFYGRFRKHIRWRDSATDPEQPNGRE